MTPEESLAKLLDTVARVRRAKAQKNQAPAPLPDSEGEALPPKEA